MPIDDATRFRQIIEAQSALASSGTDGLDDIMTLAAQRARVLTGAENAVIELAEGDEMVYAAVAGSHREHLGMRLSLHTSLSGLSVRTASVLRCDDIETDDRVDLTASRRLRIRSMVVTPLRHGSGALGVLKVIHSAPRAFDDRDVDTLALFADSVSGAISTALDRQRVRHLALHDPLTGLANRADLIERIEGALARSERRHETVGVLYIDLDGFKPINDRHGHRTGDEVLRIVAERLTGQSRASDIVARLGGDEFVVVVEVADGGHITDLAARIQGVVAQPIDIGGVAIRVEASIGMATATRREQVDSLLARADAAMYAAKRARRERAPETTSSHPTKERTRPRSSAGTRRHLS